MCISDYSRVSVSHEMPVYSTCEWKLSTDFTETYRLMCHNCSCGTTAVFLTRYRRKIGNIPSEDTWSSFGFIPLLAERASLSRRLSSSKSLLCVGWLQGAYGLIFWYMAPFDRDLCLEKQTSQDDCLWNIRPIIFIRVLYIFFILYSDPTNAQLIDILSHSSPCFDTNVSSSGSS